MGRGVVIKNFGTFGFSAPEVTLDVSLDLYFFFFSRALQIL